MNLQPKTHNNKVDSINDLVGLHIKHLSDVILVNTQNEWTIFINKMKSNSAEFAAL